MLEINGNKVNGGILKNNGVLVGYMKDEEFVEDNKYDGSLESLKDKSRKPHSHPNQQQEHR